MSRDWRTFRDYRWPRSNLHKFAWLASNSIYLKKMKINIYSWTIISYFPLTCYPYYFFKRCWPRTIFCVSLTPHFCGFPYLLLFLKDVWLSWPQQIFLYFTYLPLFRISLLLYPRMLGWVELTYKKCVHWYLTWPRIGGLTPDLIHGSKGPQLRRPVHGPLLHS